LGSVPGNSHQSRPDLHAGQARSTAGVFRKGTGEDGLLRHLLRMPCLRSAHGGTAHTGHPGTLPE